MTAATTTGSPGGTGADRVGESRWPMAVAVLTVMILSLFQTSDVSVLPTWFVPAIEGGFLAFLIWADPGRIDRQTPRIRSASIVLVVLILVSALASSVLLTGKLTNAQPGGSDSWEFIWDSARVWVTINIAFALLYWQLDSGGPVSRLLHPRQFKDFLFPQQADPDIAPPGWFPTFLDYLYVGFTTGNAFSPTDTMPLVHWAKIAMGAQALISFVIVGLVIARVVNVI